ncbi:XI-H [Linum perenne]
MRKRLEIDGRVGDLTDYGERRTTVKQRDLPACRKRRVGAPRRSPTLWYRNRKLNRRLSSSGKKPSMWVLLSVKMSWWRGDVQFLCKSPLKKLRRSHYLRPSTPPLHRQSTASIFCRSSPPSISQPQGASSSPLPSYTQIITKIFPFLYRSLEAKLANMEAPGQEKLEALITCVEKKKVGFHQGKPVAAVTIYRCLVEWGSFEAQRTSIFDHLIFTIGAVFEHEDEYDYLAYWLSNCAMLLFLLQRTLIRGNCDVRVGKDFILPVVDPKKPALLFKQQVTAYLETIYGMMRENEKKELSPLLASCIKAAKAKRNDVGLMNWNRMVESFESMLSSMKENFVPTFFIRKVFCQIFFHIDVNLFNSLLLRPECCTSSNGEFVKSGLDRLKAWCAQANQKLIRSAWDELKHTKQAVGFLVIHKKSKLSYEELSKNLCPVISISQFTLCSLRKLSDCKNAALFLQALSVQQLHRLCTMYEDENINTGNGISPHEKNTFHGR